MAAHHGGTVTSNITAIGSEADTPMRTIPDRGRSPLECPDTDSLVKHLNKYLGFMNGHPRFAFSHWVACLYWGRLCTRVHEIHVPMFKRWTKPKEMFNNLAISFWLLNDKSHTGTESEIKRVFLLTKEEAKAANAQFSKITLSFAPIWISMSFGIHIWKVDTQFMDPWLFQTTTNVTNLPVDLEDADASYVSSILERFFDCLLADDSDSGSSISSAGTTE
ncbi:hypothetical protein MPER_07911 [Moniliophthora perniciosa FA553]|nr:hypothetical protein MPER_07911 [Moniliophthora perniciosa FA553]